MNNRLLVYVGTYGDARNETIPVFEMDTKSGALSRLGGASGVANPSFLALHPSGKSLYAASEIGGFEGKPTGAVAALALDPKTHLPTLLNQQPSEGNGPCFVAVEPKGKYVVVANYGGGSVACLPVEADGRLRTPADSKKHQGGSGVNAKRQDKPYAHSINPDPSGRFAVAADLGMDKLLVYRIDPATGSLIPNNPPFASTKPGAGPRHTAFHPNGKFLYAINELDSTIAAYKWDGEKGTLTEFQTLSTLPEGYDGRSSCAEVVVHPNGKHLYGSNRGHDSLVHFAVDPGTGRLRLEGHTPTGGKNPRNFAIEPSGRFLVTANQDTDNLVVFRIDERTGRPSPAGQTATVSKPVCVRFLTV